MLLKLKPVLGSFVLCAEKQGGPVIVGERNSTRWIVDILQDSGPEALNKNLCISFNLIHGSSAQQGLIHAFMFGAHHPGMYDARPVLDYDEETRRFRVTAQPVEAPTAYRLSIDILHSMHR